MDKQEYHIQTIIEQEESHGGAYVRVPFDLRKEFGRGRLPVEATFDGEPYVGSIVNMGVKNPDGSICYILGIRKDIRAKIGKKPGDTVSVTIKPMQEKGERTMWQCPKCGRSFKNTNQDHYCGEPPKTIAEYIACQPESVQPYLQEVNLTIREAIPDAKEKISWSMPTYWKKRNLIQFAAFKHHIGLYPGPEAVEAFAEQLQDFYTAKGSIRLPYDKPLPLALIAEIARWCAEVNGK